MKGSQNYMIRPIVLTVIISVALLTGCSREARERIEQQHQTDLVKHNQQFADEISAQILYFQDKKTGLCYAYYWGGAGNGGPALTLVPRDKVEQFLINK